MMGMPHMMGVPKEPTKENKLQEQKAENKEEKQNQNQNQENNEEEGDIRKKRTKKALQKIHSNTSTFEPKVQAPAGTKRVSQANILNNPKFAMLARMMGGRGPGAPMPKKENKSEEVKIETEKENQDEIIMSKPTLNKNITKKKPKKILFSEEVVQEVSDEERESITNDKNIQENK